MNIDEILEVPVIVCETCETRNCSSCLEKCIHLHIECFTPEESYCVPLLTPEGVKQQLKMTDWDSVKSLLIIHVTPSKRSCKEVDITGQYTEEIIDAIRTTFKVL